MNFCVPDVEDCCNPDEDGFWRPDVEGFCISYGEGFCNPDVEGRFVKLDCLCLSFASFAC